MDIESIRIAPGWAQKIIVNPLTGEQKTYTNPWVLEFKIGKYIYYRLEFLVLGIAGTLENMYRELEVDYDMIDAYRVDFREPDRSRRQITKPEVEDLYEALSKAEEGKIPVRDNLDNNILKEYWEAKIKFVAKRIHYIPQSYEGITYVSPEKLEPLVNIESDKPPLPRS